MELINYIDKIEEIAVALKFIRECRELKQWQVADMLGIDRSTYTCYELGKCAPNIFVLIELSRIFNVQFVYLVTKDGAMKARKIMNIEPEPKIKIYNYLNTKESVSKRLKTIRTKSKRTQRYIARKLKIDRSTYTSYELGKTLPSVLTILKIIEIFKIPIHDFLLES